MCVDSDSHAGMMSGDSPRVGPKGAGTATAQSETQAAPGVSLAAQVSKGVGALSLGAVVNIVGQVSLVPVALYAWGETRYGEWVLLTGLVSFLGLTDLGLQTFVANRLCASYARQSREDMSRILHSALQVQCPLVAALLALVAAALFFTSLDRVLHLQTVAGLELSVVVLLLATELSIRVPMGVIGGIYRATGRLARAAMIGNGQQLALVGISIALIAGRASFVSLAAARIGIALIWSTWFICDLRRLYPWLRIWPASGSWHEGLRMIGPGLFFLLVPVADYLSNQVTLLVVQRALGASEVSRLATHRTVVNLAQMASGLLTAAIWPELTALHARSQNQHLVQVRRSLTKFNMWLVGALAFGLLPFLPWIYPSWTAGRLMLDEWTVAFLVIRLLVWSMWSASMTLLLATNRHQPVALAILGSAAITSLVAIPLVPVMGISGAALAGLLGDLCVTAWLVPSLTSRAIGDHVRDFVAQVGPALLAGVGIPVGFGLVAWYLFPISSLRYLVIIPFTTALAFALIWWQLDSVERRLTLHLYERMFANRRT